jgi:hypothetical protein
VTSSLRGLAKKILAVRRAPTYFLPWLARNDLDCVLILNNVEARFREGHRQGPFAVSAVQYDADGTPVKRYDASLADNTDVAEVALEPTGTGCGFVTVDVSRVQSDHYVTLSDGVAYSATHGRQEFIERYPIWARALMALLGGALARIGRTIPAFVRHQYAYAGPGSHSHLLLLNLSNVTNRIRVTARHGGARVADRLVRVPPMGSALLEADRLAGAAATGQAILQLTLEGNAWFNLYLVGAGSRGLTGPLTLMHVK